MQRTIALTLVLLLPGLLTATLARGAEPPVFQVYVLAIGSSTYAEPASPDQHRVDDIYGANNGAKALARRFQKLGARFAMTLTSDEGHLVSLEDIQRALQYVEARIIRERPAHPLLLFYFAGHGISEGVGWNHFSLPGTFTYVGAPDKLDLEQLATHTLHAATLVAQLEKAKVSYLLLLDTCYEGKTRDFRSPVLSPIAQGNLGDIAEALRFANEFHQAHPVLFSAKPGQVVEIAPDPDDPQARSMGPLARRAALILDRVSRSEHRLSLANFVQEMSDPDLDMVTAPAVTHANFNQGWSAIIAQAAGAESPAEARVGSGSRAIPCCVPASSSATTGASSRSRGMTGTIQLTPIPGEFISGGKPLTLRSPPRAITLDQLGPGHVTILAQDQDREWTIDLVAPAGRRLAVGRYQDTQRADFQEGSHPGLSIEGAGHACNQARGQFMISQLRYDAAEEISVLEASLIQFCDSNPSPLRAEIRLYVPRTR